MPPTERPRRRAPKPRTEARPAAKRRVPAPYVPPDPLEESTAAPAAEAFEYWEQPETPAQPAFDPNRTLGEWLNSLVPPEAQLHFLNAGREFALGMQVTLDHHSGRAQVHRSSPTQIDIE